MRVAAGVGWGSGGWGGSQPFPTTEIIENGLNIIEYQTEFTSIQNNV